MKWLKRNWMRILSVLIFSVLALDLFPEKIPRGYFLLPRLSPLLNIGGAIAVRRFVGWTLLLGIPLLILPIFKGRYFCWRICPMGFLAELAGKLNPWGKQTIRKVPAINQLLASVIVVTAICGYPLVIWLDPLCIFNGFFSAWREPLGWTTSVTAIGFLFILLISIIAPNIWCHRICPLGGLQESIMKASQKIKQKAAAKNTTSATPTTQEPIVSRRAIIATIPIAITGIVAKKTLGHSQADVIRPPTAKNNFNAVCARCGNCMRACPDHLIVPDLGESGIDGLFTPVLQYRSRNENQESFCFQECVACTKVCPTGALHPITEEIKKKSYPMGIARIDKQKCLAWHDHEYCVVCDEYCPFKAIIVQKDHGVMCPAVDPDKCRGCGACESQCPALPIAITVHALHKRVFKQDKA